MKKYLGIILIVLGALMLVISYFVDLVDYNGYNVGALLLIVIGLIAHIQITKRQSKDNAILNHILAKDNLRPETIRV